MHSYVKRHLESSLLEKLDHYPAVALLGPRQCGKTTLVKKLLGLRKKVVYLDLESNSDLRKLDDPELFFSHIGGNLVCLDEIQRRPDLFPVLRSILCYFKRLKP